MNNNDRHRDHMRRIIEDYNNINREYNLNMMDYHRNIRQMINALTQNDNINAPVNESRRRNASPRNREALELELLNYYITQINSNLQREPMPRVLTQNQIDELTEIVTYDDASMNEQRCPITHEDFESGQEVCRIIQCGHYFKPDAIQRWFNRNTICPVCRHNLLNTLPADSPTIPIFPNIFSNNIVNNNTDPSYNTVTYTFDIPFNMNI